MRETKRAGIFFLLLHGFAAALNCTSPTPESLFDAFERELFPKKLLRPVKSFSDTMNITIDVTVVGILGVNEKAQTLSVFIWQILSWNIAGLSWDEKECGTKRVSVPREKLWIPDVHISEFMDEDKSPKTPYVYLDYTGLVFDDKPIRVVSSCHMEIYTFPFDIQNCSLTFGSHLHFASEVRMIQHYTAAQILETSRQVLQTKGEWELEDIQIAPSHLDIGFESYSTVKFFLILARRPVMYVVNLLIPSCFLITLDLFSFLLPPQSVDRSAFKMTLILGYTVFLLIMNDLLPVTGNTTPLLNVLFSVSLALMVASLLETVFIANIQFSSSHYSVVPHWLRVLVLRYLAVVVCLPPKKKSNRVTVSLRPSDKKRCLNMTNTNELPDTNHDMKIVCPAEIEVDIISSRDLHSRPGDAPPEKPSPDPTLDELRKLSRDLAAIRLHVNNHLEGTKSSQEWQMIGMVIDRLLFGMYIVFISVSFVTITCLWHFTQTHNHEDD